MAAPVVVVRLAGSDDVIDAVVVDPVGAYEISGLPEGSYDVTFQVDGRAPVTETVTVAPGSTTVTDLITSPPLTLLRLLVSPHVEPLRVPKGPPGKRSEEHL